MVGAQTTRGSVFIFIIIAIVLFGALGMTFARSASKGTGNLSGYRAKQYAMEMTSYAGLIMQSLEKLRMKGCALSQISFDGTPTKPWTTIVNPNSPTDFSCHIFHDNGGKITPIDSTGKNYIDYSLPELSPYWFYAFSGSMKIAGIGSDTPATGYDLVLRHAGIKDEVCRQINNLSGIPNPPTGTPDGQGVGGAFYKGQGFSSVGAVAALTRTLDGSSVGFSYGCFRRSHGDNHFYFTLVAR